MLRVPASGRGGAGGGGGLSAVQAASPLARAGCCRTLRTSTQTSAGCRTAPKPKEERAGRTGGQARQGAQARGRPADKQEKREGIAGGVGLAQYATHHIVLDNRHRLAPRGLHGRAPRRLELVPHCRCWSCRTRLSLGRSQGGATCRTHRVFGDHQTVANPPAPSGSNCSVARLSNGGRARRWEWRWLWGLGRTTKNQ